MKWCCIWRAVPSVSSLSLDTFIRRHSSWKRPKESNFSSRSSHVVVHTNSDCIYENLATEEALLRGVVLEKGQGMLMLYVDRPCVVVGRNQNILTEVSMRRAVRDGVEVARRSSGGGAVYHDHGNLCLSFFTHRTDYAPEKTIQILRSALSAGFGLDPARLTSTPRHDLFLDGKKITGSAMRVQRDVAFHHCTLLLSSRRESLGSYLSSEQETVFFHTSAVSSVRSPVTTLAEEVAGTGEAKIHCVYPDTSSLLSVPAFDTFMGHFYLRFASKVMETGEIIEHDEVQHFLAEEKATHSVSLVNGGVKTSHNCRPADSASEERASNSFLSRVWSLDVRQAMQDGFSFLDGEGRRPSSSDALTLAGEVDRTASLAWLWNMPKFESVVTITAEELRRVLLCFMSPDFTAESKLWEKCVTDRNGDLRDAQDLLEGMLEAVFGPSKEAANKTLFFWTTVHQRRVVSLSFFLGPKEANVTRTTIKEIKVGKKNMTTTTTSFDHSKLAAVPWLLSLVQPFVLEQNADEAGDSLLKGNWEEASGPLSTVLDGEGRMWFDACPPSSRAPFSGLIVLGLLKIWKQKNVFDFADTKPEKLVSLKEKRNERI